MGPEYFFFFLPNLWPRFFFSKEIPPPLIIQWSLPKQILSPSFLTQRSCDCRNRVLWTQILCWLHRHSSSLCTVCGLYWWYMMTNWRGHSISKCTLDPSPRCYRSSGQVSWNCKQNWRSSSRTPHHTTPHHTTPHHTAPYHTTPYHTTNTGHM